MASTLLLYLEGLGIFGSKLKFDAYLSTFSALV